jgi:ribosome-binding factor A
MTMAHRIERVNNLIRQEVSELLRRQVKDPRLGSFVTVTEVSTSPDLRFAKVFVSHIASDEEKQETLSGLAAASGFLRNELAKRLELRRIPELRFQWDDSIERGAHLLTLIDKVASDNTPHRHSD